MSKAISSGRAIILAGGRGSRLRESGVEDAKPLVRLGGWRLIEIILRQLAVQGFKHGTLCITPVTEAIQDLIGDGEHLGLCVDYCLSERLLGTAGALRLVKDWNEPAVVVNGDLLTSFDYSWIRHWHMTNCHIATIALVRPSIPLPYALVEVDEGGRILHLQEKPVLRPVCASGVYVLEPGIREMLGEAPIDMPELLLRLLCFGRSIGGVEIAGRWHDIGTAEALRRAEADLLANPQEFLPDFTVRQETGCQEGTE